MFPVVGRACLAGCKLVSISFRFPIEIAFSAVQEWEFVFHLKCKVCEKFAPLCLNVKTEGYAVRMALVAKDADGKETLLPLEREADRIINFREVRNNHWIVNFSCQFLPFRVVVVVFAPRSEY